jgi:hypothetical protein
MKKRRFFNAEQKVVTFTSMLEGLQRRYQSLIMDRSYLGHGNLSTRGELINQPERKSSDYIEQLVTNIPISKSLNTFLK